MDITDFPKNPVDREVFMNHNGVRCVYVERYSSWFELMEKIQRKVVLLQYRNVGEHTSVGEGEARKFVALDSASGGYPYAVEIQYAADFKTVAAALEYSRKLPGFVPREVTITYEF